jgi:hypothetical protein
MFSRPKGQADGQNMGQFSVETSEAPGSVLNANQHKARRDLEDETVKAKSKAARTWIGHANAHARSHNGKPWRYALVPHDAILENVTLGGLMAKFNLQEISPEAS